MKKSKTIIIATRNKGKAKEFEELFKEKEFTVKTLLDFPEIDDVEETGVTFQENATLKAETIAQTLNTTVVADDSGLVVEALLGQPGVFSARYAGEEKNDAKNNAKLLNELADVEDNDRTAYFHCSLALAHPKKETLVIDGQVNGRILGVPRGQNGFGYDPLFLLPEKNKTMAELDDEEKNRLSHRAVALKNLEKELSNWLDNNEKKEN